MRGGAGPGGRGGVQRPSSEALTRTVSIPAPYKGWNAIGNLANMDPLQAIQMDNVFPGVQDVGVRKGCIDWATAAPANIKALLPYSGPITNKLFACTNAGIYDVTGGGVIGAAATTCTSGYWKNVMTATSGGNFMFCVNGADAAKLYDGTTWTNPTITGADTTQWAFLALHKRRIWACAQNSMNLYYLPTDSIAGAATAFPVGALFKRGGRIVAIGTYTIQYYYGPDDFFVIITSNGEFALYQGTDPASASTWSLVGIYDVAAPLGDLPIYRYGVDMLYLSQTGLLPFSKVEQAAQQDMQLDRNSNISYDIEGALLSAAAQYSANKGWQIISHKTQNLLLVNVPVSQDTASYQFVMNTTTKAWCRFTGWNASCFANFNGDLYFAGGTKVSKAWVGNTDAGQPIIGTVAQAYSPLGMKGQKQVQLVRPNYGIAGSASVILALDADFSTFGGQTALTYAPLSNSAVWNISDWDAGVWDSGISAYPSVWNTVPGNLGYLHSYRMQVTTSAANFTWTSTDFAVKGAGIL